MRGAAAALRARIGLPGPIYAHYGVTHRCNMRCRMCVVWRDGDAQNELHPEQVDSLARALTTSGVRMIALGGGEPFVRRDIDELVESFAMRGCDVRLLTNGIGVDSARIDNVITAGCRHVSISLDSLDPGIEREIYDGKDVWDDIVYTMRRFRERLTSPQSVPVMNVCVSRVNLAELPRLVRFAADERFYCSFVPISLSPSEAQSDGFAAVADDLAIREQDHDALDAAYGELLEMKRRGAPIANSSAFLRDSHAFLRTGHCEWSCDAGKLYLSVNPAGELSICHRFAPFARHDTPGLAERIKNAAKDPGVESDRSACPGCMRPCWAEVSHAVYGLRSAFEAWRLPRTRFAAWSGN